jgi:uncharacterized protein YyaL (SSP411 family)
LACARALPRIALYLLLGLAVAAPEPAAAALANVLRDHPSPYLRLHADDPVAWQEWGPAVFERARRENRLVFVSIGYFSCHWCHVMQRESYKDPEIARYLNAHFIPVKVDRELEPALDAQLIAFAAATRGMSGWPLNVFLTPAGDPLFALLYAPPAEFRAVLQRLQDLWAKDAKKLSALARAAALEAARSPSLAPPPGTPRPPPPQADRYVAKFLSGVFELADMMHGGFGAESKFPSVPQLELLLAEQARRPQAQLETFLRLTLDEMAGGGLRDHLAGGFFRYTVDPGWKTPHFEKMLYDNALLARLYLRAAQVLKHPPYAAVANETLDFLLSEMRDAESGAFVAALSAVDDQGVEGGYYLWHRDDLRRLLSPAEEEVFAARYGLADPPAFEHGYLPVPRVALEEIARARGVSAEELRGLLAAAERKLLAARRGERQLPRDDKVLAAWNGLALAAFAEAARLNGAPRYREAARALRDYLLGTLWDGEGLRRAVYRGRAVGQVSLEDYAFVAEGLLEWVRLTGEEDDARQAARIVHVAWRRYEGAKGWRLSENPFWTGAPRAELSVPDGPLPSPSAVLIRTSLALAARLGDRDLQKRAEAALARARTPAWEDPFWHATIIGTLIEHKSSSSATAGAAAAKKR